MFSSSRFIFGISPGVVFLRLLRQSKVLSTRANPDPNKPSWSAANIRHLYRTMSPQARLDLQKWSKNLYVDAPTERKVQDRRVKRDLTLLSRRTANLMDPGYVTSFRHFTAVNIDRVAGMEGNVTGRGMGGIGIHGGKSNRIFVELSKLWKKEKGAFRETQLQLMMKRRERAKLALQRRIKLAEEAKRAEMMAAARKSRGKAGGRKPRGADSTTTATPLSPMGKSSELVG